LNSNDWKKLEKDVGFSDESVEQKFRSFEQLRRSIVDVVAQSDEYCSTMPLSGKACSTTITSDENCSAINKIDKKCSTMTLSDKKCSTTMSLSDLTKLETKCYLDNGRCMYFASSALLTVFSDCTERSPTFSLKPLDTLEAEKEGKAECWIKASDQIFGFYHKTFYG
jgi:hypothetical protein